MEKRRQYDESVRETEYGSFSPFIFSTSCGIGSLEQQYKRELQQWSQQALQQNYALD